METTKNFNQQDFNNFILNSQVVGFFQKPITLTSGRKTHWYVNWRINDVFLIDQLADFIIAFTKDLGFEPDCFYGVPEGATRLGVITQYKWAKQKENYSKESSVLAMGRGKPKEHGEIKDKYFVGMPQGKVIVVEDVTTTGNSLINTLNNLKKAGVNVIGVISLTNRMEKRDDGMSVKEAVEKKGVKFHSMSSALELLPITYEKLQPGENVGRAIESEFERNGVATLKLSGYEINMADKLLKKIDEKQNPCIVGLDPQIRFFPPQILKRCSERYGKTSKAVAEAYIEFNKAIIDATYDLVPIFKLNMCFYEKYGAEGVRAFQECASYVRSKGCIILEDAKRNEVGESAKAYAEGHLGEVDMCDGSKAKSLDVNLMVVNPYIGSDNTDHFFDACKEYGKGIFILTKTSNPSSGEVQDRLAKVSVDEKLELEKLGVSIGDETELYNLVALNVNKYAQKLIGLRGYSSIGAVVGATYPEQARILRKIMPNSFFLVPGYGAQGGGAKDLMNCFNKDGYGAVVNSSRGIIFAYLKKDDYGQRIYSDEKFAEAARHATQSMIQDIKLALRNVGKFPLKWRKIE